MRNLHNILNIIMSLESTVKPKMQTPYRVAHPMETSLKYKLEDHVEKQGIIDKPIGHTQ